MTEKNLKGKNLERHAILQGLFIFIKEYFIIKTIQNIGEEIKSYL